MAFYFQYPGNKTKELPRIHAAISGIEFDTVVEPFAGTAAFARSVFATNPEKQFVIGDADQMMANIWEYSRGGAIRNLLAVCHDNQSREQWADMKLREKADPTDMEAWFYNKRVLGDFARANIFPDRWPNCDWKPDYDKLVSFSQRASTACADWEETIRPHLENPRALIFLDPPYLSSFNGHYAGMRRSVEADGTTRDLTSIFVRIRDLLRTSAATIVLVTNGNALICDLYADWIRDRYAHAYKGMTKTVDGGHARVRVEHLIVVGGGVVGKLEAAAAGASAGAAAI